MANLSARFWDFGGESRLALFGISCSALLLEGFTSGLAGGLKESSDHEAFRFSSEMGAQSRRSGWGLNESGHLLGRLKAIRARGWLQCRPGSCFGLEVASQHSHACFAPPGTRFGVSAQVGTP